MLQQTKSITGTVDVDQNQSQLVDTNYLLESKALNTSSTSMQKMQNETIAEPLDTKICRNAQLAEMMSQNKPAENGEASFEQLKDLFDEVFQSDIESFDSTSQTGSSSACSSFFSSCSESSNSTKRGSSEMSNTKTEEPEFQEFCVVRRVATWEVGMRERGGPNKFSSSFELSFSDFRNVALLSQSCDMPEHEHAEHDLSPICSYACHHLKEALHVYITER